MYPSQLYHVRLGKCIYHTPPSPPSPIFLALSWRWQSI